MLLRTVLVIFALAVLAGVFAFVWREIAAWRAGSLEPETPTVATAWRVRELSRGETVEIVVEHPRLGIRRRWRLDPGTDDYQVTRERALGDAHALAAELGGS